VRETEVFGQPRIALYAATSAADADFTAKIVRVTSNGRAEFLSIGIARSSWLFREAGYAADQDSCVGVHAGADLICARSGGAAAAGDCQLGISSLRSQSFDRYSRAACGQLELGRSTQQVLHSRPIPSHSICRSKESRMVRHEGKAVPEIALEGVSKRYRNAAVALEDISLTVERGEFVTFSRTLGLRQIDAAEAGFRAEPGERRHRCK
jgi:hypothetical protein